jgi:hypothetical protein
VINYHYCSNAAFCSIVEQKRLRLSLLSMSNDAKEGQHILDVARRLLGDDCKDTDEILKQLDFVISQVSAIGFCVSEDGDLLSQWRGYADDARGVAIGFEADVVKAAAEEENGDDIIVRFAKVAYDDEQLAEVMLPDLAPVVEYYKSGRMAPPRYPTILSPMTEEEQRSEDARHQKASIELFWMLFRIASYAYLVKSPFFKEETEWRLLSLLVRGASGLQLPSAQFSATVDKLKPFRDFPLKEFAPEMIREVVLGPRNQTPDDVIKLFLSSRKLPHVMVRRSKGTYQW